MQENMNNDYIPLLSWMMPRLHLRPIYTCDLVSRNWHLGVCVKFTRVLGTNCNESKADILQLKLPWNYCIHQEYTRNRIKQMQLEFDGINLFIHVHSCRKNEVLLISGKRFVVFAGFCLAQTTCLSSIIPRTWETRRTPRNQIKSPTKWPKKRSYKTLVLTWTQEESQKVKVC